MPPSRRCGPPDIRSITLKTSHSGRHVNPHMRNTMPKNAMIQLGLSAPGLVIPTMRISVSSIANRIATAFSGHAGSKGFLSISRSTPHNEGVPA